MEDMDACVDSMRVIVNISSSYWVVHCLFL